MESYARFLICWVNQEGIYEQGKFSNDWWLRWLARIQKPDNTSSPIIRWLYHIKVVIADISA